MVICDMCGAEVDEFLEAIVEGVSMSVCEKCSKYGEVVAIKPKIFSSSAKKVERRESEPTEVIVDNYAALVMKGREKKGFRQNELAKALGEKVSVIEGVEAGRFKPSLVLAKKFELVLGIDLVNSYKEVKGEKRINFRDKSLTIGDVVRSKDE